MNRPSQSPSGRLSLIPFPSFFALFVIAALALEVVAAPTLAAASLPPARAPDSIVFLDSPVSPSSPQPSSSTTPAPQPPAAVPTQTIGACTISQFDSVEADRFLKAVAGFSGKELTDRSDASLRTTPPANATSINVNVYNFPVDSSLQTVPLKPLAQALGVNPQDAADSLGVNVTDSITVAQANAIGSKAKKGDISQVINSLLGSKKQPTFQAPGFESMKVHLPNGKDIPLSDIYKLQEIRAGQGDQKSCLLDNANIHGRVSFSAQLDSDLTIGADRSEYVLNAPQHLSTSKFYAAVNNFDGNVLIPTEFEYYLAAVRSYAFFDEVANLVGAVAASTNLKRTQVQIEEKTAQQKDLQTLEQSSLSTLEAAKDDSGALGNIRSQYNGLDNPDNLLFPDMLKTSNAPSGKTWLTDLHETQKPGVALPSNWATLSAQQQFEAATGKTWGGDFNTKLQLLQDAGFVRGVDSARYRTALDQYKKYTDQSGKLADDLTTMRDDLGNIRKSSLIFVPRAMTNFAFGLLWIGPGRLALELAGNVFFTSLGNPDSSAGSWITIFAGNNQFAEAFRTGTDWFTSGKIFEAISDITKSGIPSKVFNVGNMMYIQEEGTSGPERDSLTSLSSTPSGWVIAFNRWPGQAQSALFEDVSDNRGTTSVALQVNNTVVGGTVQRQEAFQWYTQTLYFLVPLLGWKLSGISNIDPGISLIARLGITDFYINNIIDPTHFSAKETCSRASTDHWVNAYKIGVLASTLQTIAITNPQWLVKGISKMNDGAVKTTFQATAQLFGANVESSQYFSKWISPTINFIDPVSLYKATIATDGFNYVSTCKDTGYKLLAFKNVPQETKKNTANPVAAVQDKLSNPLGIPDLSKLNIGKAFAGVGPAVTPAQDLKEILDIKTVINDQSGMLRPVSLYNFQINPQSASMEWFAPYEQGCFRSCLQNKAGDYICSDISGVYKENPDGTRTYLADADHALMQEFLPGLGTVVPNKLISASLTCSPDPVMQASGNGGLSILPSSCPATECTVKSLVSISGTAFGNDLTRVLGKVQAVYTTEGTASADGTNFRFLRTTGTSSNYAIPAIVPRIGNNQIGGSTIDTKAATPQGGTFVNQKSLAGTEQRFVSLDLLGNAQVRVHGGDPNAHPTDDLGELRTIQTERGVIHYDPVTRKLHIALRLLADIKTSDLTGIGLKPGEIAGGQADYNKLVAELTQLANKLAANQKLSADEIDLLRKALERSAPTGSGLTPQERDLLQKAVAKENAGQPLTKPETDVLTKAQAQERYPGVIVLPPQQIETVGRIMNDQGIAPATAASIVDKLNTKTPLTPDEKNTATTAISNSQASGKTSAADAKALTQSIQQATSTSGRAQEIVDASARGTPLTDAQKADVQGALSREQKRAVATASTASAAPLPALQLTGAVDKIGGDTARELNTALDKIGPLTHVSTPQQDVLITHNAAGQPVVDVLDKQSGQTKELQVTGPAVQQGGSVSIPTKDGPLKFDVNVNKDSGAPQITINGPGLAPSTAPMILMQGPNGLLYYDPQTGTWRALNGLAIPADPLFGTNGVQLRGGPDGTRGVPASDPFGYNTNAQPITGTNPLLSLPGWPADALPMGAMLALVLGGFLLVRRRVHPRPARPTQTRFKKI